LATEAFIVITFGHNRRLVLPTTPFPRSLAASALYWFPEDSGVGRRRAKASSLPERLDPAAIIGLYPRVERAIMTTLAKISTIHLNRIPNWG
jgi:hypothetical protein